MTCPEPASRLPAAAPGRVGGEASRRPRPPAWARSEGAGGGAARVLAARFSHPPRAGNTRCLSRRKWVGLGLCARSAPAVGARRQVVRGPGAVRAGTGPSPAACGAASAMLAGVGARRVRAGVARGASRVAGPALEQFPPGTLTPEERSERGSEVTWTPQLRGALSGLGEGWRCRGRTSNAIAGVFETGELKSMKLFF